MCVYIYIYMYIYNILQGGRRDLLRGPMYIYTYIYVYI